jgi:chromate transport protein ChrA
MSEQPTLELITLDCAEAGELTIRDLLVYFVHLGTFGFGGPIGHAGYMQRDLVESRRWISRSDYLARLAFSQPSIPESILILCSGLLCIVVSGPVQ